MGLSKHRKIKIFGQFGISFEKTEAVTMRRRLTTEVVQNEQRDTELTDRTAAVMVQSFEDRRLPFLDGGIVDEVESTDDDR